MKEVLKKLCIIQAELKAPKNQFNKFGGYKYRSCEDILEAAKPLCNKHGCTLTVGDKLENIGNRYYIAATATLYENESGESISNTAYAREEESKKGMDGSQITGTASSYARKYALNGLFCIDDAKDADTDEYKQQQNKAQDSEVKCPKCGKIITPITKTNGSVAQPADILKGCGGVCYDCYQKAKS
jgi:hypothetical protein